MAAKKIACIGGGSLHFPRIIAALVARGELSDSEMVLYDLVQDKADYMAAKGQQLALQAGHGWTVRAATELADSLEGADFVLTSIGGSGGGPTLSVYGSYYHQADMHISARHGLYQVIGDTCGPAGMMMALRAIPPYVEACQAMETHCPDAILLNHTNPMAPICRAMRKYSSIQAVGVCHGVENTTDRIASELGLPADELQFVWCGTNHYYWVLRVTHKGKDITADAFAKVTGPAGEGETDTLWRELSAVYGYIVGIPSGNHLIEFYPWATRVRGQDEQPPDLVQTARRHSFDDREPMPTRDDPSAEDLTTWDEQFRGCVDGQQLPPPDATKSIAIEPVDEMISAIARGSRETFTVNIPNDGIHPNLPRTALVETEAVTDANGFRGISVGDCPPVLKGMLEKRFAWHDKIADAAVNGDRQAALQAMLLDEMALSPKQNEALLEDLLEASRDRLPRFFS